MSNGQIFCGKRKNSDQPLNTKLHVKLPLSLCGIYQLEKCYHFLDGFPQDFLVRSFESIVHHIRHLAKQCCILEFCFLGSSDKPVDQIIQSERLVLRISSLLYKLMNYLVKILGIVQMVVDKQSAYNVLLIIIHLCFGVYHHQVQVGLMISFFDIG